MLDLTYDQLYQKVLSAHAVAFAASVCGIAVVIFGLVFVLHRVRMHADDAREYAPSRQRDADTCQCSRCAADWQNCDEDCAFKCTDYMVRSRVARDRDAAAQYNAGLREAVRNTTFLATDYEKRVPEVYQARYDEWTAKDTRDSVPVFNKYVTFTE